MFKKKISIYIKHYNTNITLETPIYLELVDVCFQFFAPKLVQGISFTGTVSLIVIQTLITSSYNTSYYK